MKTKILLLILFICLFIWGLISEDLRRKRIRNNAQILIAEVLELKTGGPKQMDDVVFKFTFEGKVIEGREDVGNWRKVKYRYFPVIVNSKKPWENELLLSPSQYEFYNLLCPDSIRILNIYTGNRPEF